MKKIVSIIRLVRPKQWVKNLFVFPAIIFSKEFLVSSSPEVTLNYSNIFSTFFLFFLFSVLSSSVYVINDLIDIKEDRLHPVKKKRPLASGALSVYWGLAIFIVLILLTVTASFFVNGATRIVLLIYFIMNLLYSSCLKRVPVLDIFIIALGFLFRSIAGGLVIETNITKWFLITIFMVSLTIAAVKRRGEFLIKKEGRRAVLKYYNQQILDIFVILSSVSALITYCIFSLTYEIESFYITIPFALYGIMRYLFISYTDEKKSGSPDEVITSDVQIIITGLLYGLSVFLSLFIFH